jgi:uncharacterized membrane protein YbhN (UPF0104 family)
MQDPQRGVAPRRDAPFTGRCGPLRGRLVSKLRMRWVAPLSAIAVACFAAWILHRELSTEHLRAALAAARSMPAHSVALALAFAGCSFLVLSLYDALALTYVGRHVPYRRTLLASFVACAVANNLGLPAVTGGAVRYRLYKPRGLHLADVALLTAFNAFTQSTGLALGAGVALVVSPGHIAAWLGVSDAVPRAAGLLALAGVAGYVVVAGKAQRVVHLGRWSLRAPGPSTAAAQPVLGLLDLTMTCAVLWNLLPADNGIGFATFVGVFALASIAGNLSRVPGGLGVFESMILVLLPGIAREELVASLIAYRAVYYLQPLGLAGLVFAGEAAATHRARRMAR